MADERYGDGGDVLVVVVVTSDIRCPTSDSYVILEQYVCVWEILQF